MLVIFTIGLTCSYPGPCMHALCFSLSRSDPQILLFTPYLLLCSFIGPPSVARNFHTLESRTRANTITVMWERPLITGRDDYFYNIQYSNPDIPGSFVQHNSNPLVTTSPVVRYSVSGLRPQTRYTIRLSVLNGVSDQDSAREEGRRSEVMATSGDISK